MAMSDEVYVGDGLYASFDGYQIKLRAPRSDGDHEVYLEPETYVSLRRFISDTVVPLHRAGGRVCAFDRDAQRGI